MSILETIKRLLGMETAESAHDRNETVGSGTTGRSRHNDEDSAEPATASEAAVKGTDESDGFDEPDEPDETDENAVDETDETDENAVDEPDEPVAAETEAVASTGTLVDEEDGHEPAEVVGEAETETGAAAEPAEAAGPVADDADDESDEEEPDGELLTVVKGIGPAYAETLSDVGIRTVSDLADADPDSLAEETGISAKRLERWIGRAQHR